MEKRIQAKHLPDDQVLVACREVRQPWGVSHTWDIEKKFPGVPPKVVLAKLASLVRRKKLDGCACGCRGDFREL